MVTTTKKGPGRPSAYSEELAQQIFEHLEQGKSMTQIGAMKGMPNRATLQRWVKENPEFATRCARARLISADAEHEQMIDIEGKVLRGKIDPKAASVVLSSKQWRMSKLDPKKYGQKVELGGSLNLSLADKVAQARARRREQEQSN